MAHRKIGSLRSKFGISRSMNDLTHIFSDKSSKSDSEVTAEEIGSSNKYEKRSLRQKRHSGRFGKQREKDKSVSSTPSDKSREVDDVTLFELKDWHGVNINLHDGDKDEHCGNKGKQKFKEDKKVEKKVDKNKRTISKSEGTALARKLSDQVDSTVDRRISTLSWPSSDLVIGETDSSSITEEREK